MKLKTDLNVVPKITYIISSLTHIHRHQEKMKNCKSQVKLLAKLIF